MRIRLLLFLLLILHSPLATLHSRADSAATGGSTAAVACNSTTVPVQLVTQLDNGVWIANLATSTVTIWVAEVETAARMTVGAGVPIAPGNANLFTPAEGWHGALWCLAASAGTAEARINRR